jgi:NAD-dependent SIR2 family protein deacetylase
MTDRDGGEVSRVSAVRSVVDYLCSDACLPRLPGTEGGLRARQFVQEAFKELGLVPAGEDGYVQPIPEIDGANVIGMIPGSSTRSIVVGAHFDACAIDGGINPGASDNAASVAAMLEVAKHLAAGEPLDRTVVFIAFDAEEPPYFQTPRMGSRYFVAHPTVDLESVDLMVCLDMVGHRIGNGNDRDIARSMIVFGSEKSPDVAAALGEAPPVDGLTVRRMDVDLIGQVSDYSGFHDAAIPFLFYNALRHEHYHATTDTPDTLDYRKIEALVTHLTALIQTVAARSLDPFTYIPDGRIDVESIATVRALLPTLPPTSRFARSAPGLLDGLSERAATNLSEQDRQLLRRLFLAVEDGLLDSRMWAETEVGRSPTTVSDGISDEIRELISGAVNRPGKVVVITGAGVSAESGIRTYRGANGMWTDGGQDAMLKATGAFFLRHPRKSWEWYLTRRTEARAAEPNAAHVAIADMGWMLGDRFTLVAQNIDRLHARAGTSPDGMIELHGHLEGMRCGGGRRGVWPIPEVFDGWTENDELTDDQVDLLVCPRCGSLARPHVLWFDELYDEEHYGFASAQRAVANASLCITAGTSGGVPVAARLAGIAERAGATLIDVNTRDNRLREIAVRQGGFIEGRASTAMQAIAYTVAQAAVEGNRRSEGVLRG